MDPLNVGLEKLGGDDQEERRPGLQALHPPWEPLRCRYVLLQGGVKIVAT